MASENVSDDEIREAVASYLRAFASRDEGACVAWFAETGEIDFQMAAYRGTAEIVEWHQERFAANLKVVRLESIAIDGETAVVDLKVTSDRLAAWRIGELSARVTLRFAGARIVHASVAPRVSPLDLLRPFTE